MHILFTTYEFVTESEPCGGFGHYLANFSTILAEHGHKVTILLSGMRQREFEWKPGIKVVSFRFFFSGYAVENIIDSVLNVEMAEKLYRSRIINGKIKDIHKDDPIDLIQYNGDWFDSWYRVKFIPSVVRLSSIPLWYEYASDLHNDMENYLWMNSVKMKLFIHSLRKVDGIISPSVVVKDMIAAHVKKKIEVIESPYLPADAESIVDSDLFNFEHEKYILYLGRLNVLKGIDTIIASANEILTTNADISLVLAGSIEDQTIPNRMFAAAGKNSIRIHFLGEVKEKALVQRLIENAEACIFPSRADNLPNSCIEAMGQGKVVIGTRNASFEQLIEDGISGILIERDSPQELCDAIRLAINLSEQEKLIMGNLAKKRIEDMSPLLIYSRMIEYYKTII